MIIKLDKQLLKWFLLIAPFLRPNGIGQINPFIGRIYYFAMIISLLILFFLYLKSKKFDFGFLAILSIELFWIFFVTLFNEGEIINYSRVILSLLGLTLCTEVMISNPKKLFTALQFNLEIIIYLNFIFLLCFPDGMYISNSGTGNWNNWLLGYDNHWFIVFLLHIMSH